MFRQFKRVFLSVLIVSMTVCLVPSAAFASSDDRADDIRYTIEADEVLNFDRNDFNNVCNDLTGEELNYVKFTLPDEDEGVLYYDYDRDLDDDEHTKVSGSKKYYFSSGSTRLSKVSFVPNKDNTGNVTIDYTGYDEDGNFYTGKIRITIKDTAASGTITYSIDDTDEVVDFDEDDFNKACRKIQDADLDYVKFTLPDDSDGVLYYNYDEDDDSNTKVSSSRKYYYEDTSPYIKNITFVPDDDFSGTLTIRFTGYDVNGDSFSGKVRISVDNDDSTISYRIRGNKKSVDFNEDDFNDACNDVNGEDLDYIRITIPSAAKGILYYN